jgi:hypothetical protein
MDEINFAGSAISLMFTPVHLILKDLEGTKEIYLKPLQEMHLGQTCNKTLKPTKGEDFHTDTMCMAYLSCH